MDALLQDAILYIIIEPLQRMSCNIYSSREIISSLQYIGTFLIENNNYKL